MERFIVVLAFLSMRKPVYLKSSMERFIAFVLDGLSRLNDKFKIQYGEIYR